MVKKPNDPESSSKLTENGNQDVLETPEKTQSMIEFDSQYYMHWAKFHCLFHINDVVCKHTYLRCHILLHTDDNIGV